MRCSAGRFALVVGSTLIFFAGCQTPSWMSWGKKPDASTPLASSSSTPKPVAPNSAVAKPSVAASSPAPGYGAPAASAPSTGYGGTSTNPYAGAMASSGSPASTSNPYASSTSNPYGAPASNPYAAAPVAYNSTPAPYPSTGYSTTGAYPSTATPSANAVTNPYASTAAATQPQTGYYGGNYPSTAAAATASPAVANNAYAPSAAAAVATAPAALPSKYDAGDDVLGPRPGASASPVATAPTSPAATGAQPWANSTSAASDPLAAQSTTSSNQLSPNGYTVPKQDVGNTGYNPPANGATAQMASTAGSYHPGSVKAAPTAGAWPPASTDSSSGMAPAPSASGNSPSNNSTYPSSAPTNYGTPGQSSYNQVPSYNPSANGTGYTPGNTGYPGVNVNGSVSGGGTISR